MINAIEQVAAGRKYVRPAMAEALRGLRRRWIRSSCRTRSSRTANSRRLCMLASGKRLTDIAHALLAVGENGERLPRAPAREDEALATTRN